MWPLLTSIIQGPAVAHYLEKDGCDYQAKDQILPVEALLSTSELFFSAVAHFIAAMFGAEEKPINM